jgi:hypothetical protein
MNAIQRSWRRCRTSLALDRMPADAPVAGDPEMIEVDRALRRTTPWSGPPPDLLPQTMWAVQERGTAPAAPATTVLGPGWALNRAVARAAGLAVLILAAVAATSWTGRSAAPSAPAAVASAPPSATEPAVERRSWSEGMRRLADAAARPSLSAEASAMATDLREAFQTFRASLPRRPRLGHDTDGG